jgi:phospholipase C
MAHRPVYCARPILAAASAVAAAGLLAVACQTPPDRALDRGLQVGQRNSVQNMGDPLAGRRASCAFAAGALTTETLPLTEAERLAIPIEHVVIVMKENRSFDHLLGELNAAGQAASADVPESFTNPDDAGMAVAPFHFQTTCVRLNPGHQWDAMHEQVDGGAMDGFVKSAAKSTGTDGHLVMGHYQESDLPFYYWLANTYALNDRHFASARSGTWPNRNFLLLGTADGVRCSYCGRPNPATPTIFEALDAAGATWAAYTNGEPFDGALGWSAPHRGLHPFQHFLAALAEGTLPNVSFVDGVPKVEDEHPTADLQVGEAWTRTIYEAAVASPLWPELAIIWTYDEAGGFADEVPPPNSACIARPASVLDDPFFELGVRVPLVVISPYARPHFVSHVVQEHTAITRFIEALFGLPALTARDANSDALLDMLDFRRPPALLAPPDPPAAGSGGCAPPS